MSLEELQHHWNAYIEVDLEQAGYDLETRPTYRDLLDVGAGGIQYTLREHHDMTLSEFLETVGYHETSDESYPWGIEDETTIDELESYALTLERRQNLAGTTIASKKARLTTFVQLYRDIHGQANIVDEGDDPRIHFDNRKNGPGTVALIYGIETLADRIDELGTRDRRWYTTYLESQKQLLENLDVIAADQGSSDSSVVLNNYLSEEERRNYRRAFMRDQLAKAFE